MTSSAYSDFAHDPQPVLHALARSWWLILLRGLAGIAFGVLAFAWPALTLLTLVLLYGAYALIDGIVALVAAISGRGQPAPSCCCCSSARGRSCTASLRSLARSGCARKSTMNGCWRLPARSQSRSACW